MGVGYCFGLGCLAVDAMIVAIRTNIVSVSVCLSLFVLIGTHVHTHRVFGLLICPGLVQRLDFSTTKY